MFLILSKCIVAKQLNNEVALAMATYCLYINNEIELSTSVGDYYVSRKLFVWPSNVNCARWH